MISFGRKHLSRPIFTFQSWSSLRADSTPARHISFFSRGDKQYKLFDRKLEPRLFLQGSLSSPQVWSIASDWLTDCLSNHASCIAETNTRLPSRVLDLGVGMTGDGHIKLHETTSQEVGRYVCLSHCWGPRGCSIKTTRPRLEAHKARIAFEDLPKTFQDAVTFTRWLKVRYLWIDALCILQDDENDWERESSAMAATYENSYLTLSAATANCDLDGLFSNHDRGETQYEFIHRQHGHDDIRFFFREHIPHSPIDGEFHDPSASAAFPLLSRAWAFQERILSPRVLHFGPELYWECRQTTQCECGHKGFAKLWAKREYVDLLQPSASIETPSSRLNRFTRWKRLVEKYSEQHLTYPTDRLPAISGLAKKLQQHTSSYSSLPLDYHAGIWQQDADALVWRIYGAPPQPRPHAYIAPTWSWASVNRPIRYFRLGLRDTVFYTIVAAYCVPLGHDVTGRIASGTLTVAGQVEAVVVDEQGDTSSAHWGFVREVPTRATSLLRDAVVTWDVVEGERGRPGDGLHLLRLAEIASAVLFLILGRVDEEEEEERARGCADEEEEEEIFRRLGMLQVNGYDGTEDALKAAGLFRTQRRFRMI